MKIYLSYKPRKSFFIPDGTKKEQRYYELMSPRRTFIPWMNQVPPQIGSTIEIKEEDCNAIGINMIVYDVAYLYGQQSKFIDCIICVEPATDLHLLEAKIFNLLLSKYWFDFHEMLPWLKENIETPKRISIDRPTGKPFL